MRTRIKNVSPSARFYGFLPPHGMLMAKDQEVILDGDLRTNLAIGRKQYSRATELAALQHALDGLDIEYETLTDAQSSSSPVPSSSSSAEPEPSSSSSSSAEPEPSSSSSAEPEPSSSSSAEPEPEPSSSSSAEPEPSSSSSSSSTP